MMGLYFAGKENSLPVTLFFFIETDLSAEMLLSLFYSLVHTCSRHLLKPEFVPGTALDAGNEGEKETDITPDFVYRVYSLWGERKVGSVLMCGRYQA